MVRNKKKVKTVLEQHPDWKVFNNKAQEGVIFTNFAYKQTDEAMALLADQLPPGYEMFFMTDHVQDSNKASFRCVAFMNEKNKEIVFATAGTRPGLTRKAVDDLYDDALLVAHSMPSKMDPAAVLNDMILDSLGPEARNYKFHYTGHSLGAAMAEMQAVDMDIKLRERGLKNSRDKQQITAVTFENPGTKPIVEEMYRKAGLPRNSVKKLNFCEFNNRKNIINDLNMQSGTTYTIVPNSQQERNPNFVQLMFEVVAKYVSELSPLIGKAFSLLAPGGIGTELVRDHSLSNFNEVFVQKAGIVKDRDGRVITLQEAYSGIKPVQYDAKVASKIKDLRRNNNIEGNEFSMDSFDPATARLERLTFGREELQAALSELRAGEHLTSGVKGKFTARLQPQIEGKGKAAQQVRTSENATIGHSPRHELPTAEQALYTANKNAGRHGL